MSHAIPLALLAWLVVVLSGCSAVPSVAGESEHGISLDLARSRSARVRNVRHHLTFDLHEGMTQVVGRSVIHFELAHAKDVQAEDLLIDFDGTLPERPRLNGIPIDRHKSSDHLLLPGELLIPGSNRLEVRHISPVAATGTPLTRYVDRSHGEEYLYTLLVPADAHRLFPCFDQPDLRARVERLELRMPAAWQAVANGLEEMEEERVEAEGRRVRVFGATEPLPTYLMAFAAGPFAILERELPQGATVPRGIERPLRIFLRPTRLEDVDRVAIFDLHDRALLHMEEAFARPYPFHKLDVVLCPGFPYGGMEHAGAIFYRETALVFDHEPTELELFRRSSLIYHEVAHQWFGNLVTLNWFDDLWLKEGFATFAGYRAHATLEPEARPWLRFHLRVKPAALRVDETEGTTPIYQELQNLDDAKSNYGPIVYNKAPAVLRELESRLGEPAFWNGVRMLLSERTMGSAGWRDLLHALEAASGEDLGPWSRMWFLERGMPRIQAQVDLREDGLVRAIHIRQMDDLQGRRVWPLRLKVLVGDAAGARREHDVVMDGASVELPGEAGRKPPRFVLPNADDVAFAQITLDPDSLSHWLLHLPEEPNALLRATAFSATLATLRRGACDPLRFLSMATRILDRERDAQMHQSVVGACRLVLDRFLAEDWAKQPRERLVSALHTLLLSEDARRLRLTVLRELAWLARDDSSLSFFEQVLDGRRDLAGVTLGPRDRFLLLASLLAAGREGAEERLRAMSAAGGDVERWAYAARAAIPRADVKAELFATFLDPEGPPEQWVSGALAFFHWPGQEALVLPYLRPALESAPWVKVHRKIFFMPAWLEAFLGAHASQEALAVAETFLREHPRLEADIRRKIAVPLHDLRRATRLHRAH